MGLSYSEGRTLRIGFDGRALTSPAGGVRRYANELLRALIDLREPLEFVILGGDPSTPMPASVTRVAEPWHPPTNLGWTLVGLPLAVRRSRIDVLHAPAYTAPFWSAAPVVLTIHDVSYARHPDWFPYRRDVLRRAFYRRSALSADVVITDSQYSASEIHAAYGIAPDRIAVVPLGVDASFTANDEAAVAGPGASAPVPFVLHVGDLHERRNLPALVTAVLDVRRRGGALASLSLVLAGVDRGVGDSVRMIAEQGGAPEAVVLLGFVDELRLRALYRDAAALLYPSLYEGFGLPLLEAMACGTPVIASREASIPEVVGDAGILLDPRDTPAWVDAITRVVTDRSVRDAMRASGLARAAAFSWERTARQTLTVYRRAADAASESLLKG